MHYGLAKHHRNATLEIVGQGARKPLHNTGYELFDGRVYERTHVRGEPIQAISLAVHRNPVSPNMLVRGPTKGSHQ